MFISILQTNRFSENKTAFISNEILSLINTPRHINSRIFCVNKHCWEFWSRGECRLFRGKTFITSRNPLTPFGNIFFNAISEQETCSLSWFFISFSSKRQKISSNCLRKIQILDAINDSLETIFCRLRVFSNKFDVKIVKNW